MGTALAAALAALAFPAGAAERDDDLALVKRAVARNEASQVATPPAELTPPAPPARASRAPRWLKVRIAPESGGGEKVSVNVPLALVRLVGDVDVDLGCEDEREREREACRVSVLDLLDGLKPGQNLVEIEGGDATIRVWVE
jgi:hypothetical protein